MCGESGSWHLATCDESGCPMPVEREDENRDEDYETEGEDEES